MIQCCMYAEWKMSKMNCSSHNKNTNEKNTMMDKCKLYPWRSALFHAYAGNGVFESMVFCPHSTYTPDEEILNDIIKRGGYVTSKPYDDLYTINLVNTKTENYVSDPQFKEKYDLFDSTFIERCVEKKQIIDLNLYRIGDLTFEEYDANEVLNRRLKWNEIKKKPVSRPVSTSSTTNSSLNPVLHKPSEKSKPFSVKPNERANLSSVPQNISSTHKSGELGTIEPSKRKNILESSSPLQSEHSSTESSQKNSRSSKSSSQPGSSQKKKCRIENYLSDSSSSSGTGDTTETGTQRRESHPRNRLSQKNLHPSDETLRLKSVSQNSDDHNSTTITKVFDELTALSRTDLYPKQADKVLEGPITRNKSKTLSLSPHKSIPNLKITATSYGAAANSTIASTSTNNVDLELETFLNNRIDSPPKSQRDEQKKSNAIPSKISLSKSRASPKVSTQKSSISNDVENDDSSSSTGSSSTTVNPLVPSTSKTSMSVSKPTSSSQGSSKSAREKSINISKSKDPSKVPTQISISNDVENADSDSSSSTGSSTTTVQSSVHPTSKASRSASKPVSSSQGSSKSEREKSVNYKRQRRTENVSMESAPASFRPPACSSPITYPSLWISTLRDMNKPNRSQPEPEEEPEVRPKRRHVTSLEDDRPTRCISPVESVFENDFSNRTGSTNSSTTTFKRPYNQQEKDAILKFVCDNNYHEYIRGNIMWRKLQATELVPDRTWQSLREHFNKQIFPNLNRNRKLKNEDKKKFERATKVVKLKQKRKAPF